MKGKIVVELLKTLLKLIPPEELLVILDMLKDKVDEVVKESDNKVDDVILLVFYSFLQSNLRSEEAFKEVIDMILDPIENKFEESKNKIDDVLFLPLCKIIRIVLDVPDNDIVQ